MFSVLKNKKLGRSAILWMFLIFAIINPLTAQATASILGIAADALADNLLTRWIANVVGTILMGLASLFLIVSGLLFDFIIDLTIINFAEYAGTGSNIGKGISEAWMALRDVANMLFIFILLYTAFKAMFMSEVSNVGKSILNIILIALLINFSLFFSKVIIDASNIAADGFYRAISSSNDYTLSGSNTGLGGTGNYKGITAGYMKMLGLQTWYSADALRVADSSYRIIAVGFLASVFMFIAAIIFFITGIMFAARFIILVFLMILSPLAFIAYITPNLKDKFSTWLHSLLNQAFFAPIFFALTWIAFKVGSATVTAIPAIRPEWANSNLSQLVTEPKSAMGLIIGYVLVIGFSIAALIISKQMASKGAMAVAFTQITSVATGGAAWASRQTIGRAGKYFSGRADLQEAAATKTGVGGALSRLALGTSKAAASSTFDARNATVPTHAIGSVIEGTLGRTKYGKALGLNDVNIPNIELGSRLIGKDFGTPGTKGYKETKAESDKRVQEREAAQASELALAKAKNDVKKGASTTATTTDIDNMEKALSKLSDKETETLVASNRELLRSQNFANAISVKQLEALNKSDQFSEAEKGSMKSMRFKTIDTAMIAGGPGASTVRNQIRNLADSELEMMSPEHLESADFVSQLKTSQFEAVNKSNKFTTNQKEKLRAARRKPLADALVRRNIADVEKALKSLGPKEISSIDIANLKLPTMIQAYSSQLLKKMAPEMNPSDIVELRDAIMIEAAKPGAPKKVTDLRDWLSKPDGAIFS